jgi:hypothetical protein
LGRLLRAQITVRADETVKPDNVAGPEIDKGGEPLLRCYVEPGTGKVAEDLDPLAIRSRVTVADKDEERIIGAIMVAHLIGAPTERPIERASFVAKSCTRIVEMREDCLCHHSMELHELDITRCRSVGIDQLDATLHEMRPEIFVDER